MPQYIKSHAFFKDNNHSDEMVKTKLCLVADNLRTPGNVGFMLRLADFAAVNRIIFLQDATNVQNYNPRRIRQTARHTDQFLNWQITPWSEWESILPSLPQPLIAVDTTDNATNIMTTPLPATCTLIVGNETHGISQRLLDACTQSVYIPMFGKNSSINVTHALSIALYEHRRQHSQHNG